MSMAKERAFRGWIAFSTPKSRAFAGWIVTSRVLVTALLQPVYTIRALAAGLLHPVYDIGGGGGDGTITGYWVGRFAALQRWHRGAGL